MSSKRILMIFPIPLFPCLMASQDSVLKMAERLSKDHCVDVLTLVKSKKDIIESQKGLNKICNSFIPVKAINYHSILRKPLGVIFLIFNFIFGISKREFYWGNIITIKKIIKIIKEGNYDIVQLEIGYQYKIFNSKKVKAFKVLSSHDVLHQKKQLEFERTYKGKIPATKKRELKKYIESEFNALKSSDLIISVSKLDVDYFKSHLPKSNIEYIPVGRDLEYFQKIKIEPVGSNILFYGSLSSPQNIIAFNRFYSKIYPIIKNEITNLKILVVGAKPPKEIKNLDDGINIIVTGFVQDVRDYLAISNVLIVPLEIGGGFRGRVIEVLAMGIPVVGTHNGLDCVEIQNGVHGYVNDDDKKMAESLIKICNDTQLRSELSRNCLKFVKEQYSIESTYGKLSKIYANYEIHENN